MTPPHSPAFVTPSSRPRPFRSAAPGFVVALTAWAAATALAHTQIDPAGAAETAHLALILGGVLLALALRGPALFIDVRLEITEQRPAKVRDRPGGDHFQQLG